MSENSKFETTMRALEQSRSTNSMVALIHALKVKIPGIRNEAARAILRSGSSLGKIEIIRNVKSLSPEIVASLGNDESNLDLPIGHCLQHGDDEIALRALDTIEAGKIYRELPLVLNFLRKSTGLAAERAEQVLSSLIEGAYEMQRDLRGDKLVVHSQQIEGIIQQLWTELNAAVPQVRVEILATMILILTDAEHPVARMLIREANEIVQKTVWELLKTSKHPGILRHLNSALSVKYIPSGIIDVITSRSDIEFQIAFLRATPEKPNIHQDRNYKLINGLVWLNPTPELWETVPEELHPAVIRTIKLISLNEFMKSAFAQSIFQEGSIAARKAAPEFKAYLSQDQFERLILHAVESENPEEEAWGLSVIQDTGVPEKHRYLVNKLDSPHDVVVEQARKSIGRFDVAGVIEFAESAKPAVGPRLAELFMKINPFGIQELSRELAHPIRTRRLRAARAVQKMQIQSEVTPALLELLLDSDSIVRRMGAEILGDVPTRQVKAALRSLFDDNSERVREAAHAAVKKIEETLNSGQPAVLKG